MTFTSTEARNDLLEEIAGAADELALALACLGEAFDAVDVDTADRLEEELFRPVQTAFARSKQTCSGFAARHSIEVRELTPQEAGGTPSQGAHGYMEQATAAVGRADLRLAELQDSMKPVEVGDEELRSGISAIRDLLAGVAESATDIRRRLGR